MCDYMIIDAITTVRLGLLKVGQISVITLGVLISYTNTNLF